MAADPRAQDPFQELCEEANCPVCLDYFKDPVILDCGHNFCRTCLTQFWEKPGNTETSCPHCREIVSQKNLRTNQQLANIVEKVKIFSLQGPKKEKSKERVCEKHQEPLQLFCKDDETLICEMCDKEHFDHRRMPLGIAAQDYKVLMSLRRDDLVKEKAKFLEYKAETEKEAQSLLDVRKLLQRFEEKQTSEKPVAFPSELKWKIWEFCDLNSFLVAALKPFRVAFLDALLPGLELQKANVTLDPDTAAPWLILSEDQKCVRWEAKYQDLPDNSDRFSNRSYVLGCEGFTSGRHFWEVVVGGEQSWSVGVARKSVWRKTSANSGPLDGVWQVGKWAGKYQATSHFSSTNFLLSEKTKRVRICLNYASKQVAFYDADTGDQIYVLSDLPFSGETVLPFFYVNKGHFRISS